MTATDADAAWVTINTPLDSASLAEFCGDVERLFRINPYLEFKDWRAIDGTRFAVSGRNLSNQSNFDVGLALHRASEREFTVSYDHGIKRRTRFAITPGAGGSQLTITDEYEPGPDTDPDTTEVDRSLHAWGVALAEYLRHQARWGRHAWWRWYMRRVWIPMRPAARRITYILLVLTVFEIALFALGAAIYWIEYRS